MLMKARPGCRSISMAAYVGFREYRNGPVVTSRVVGRPGSCGCPNFANSFWVWCIITAADALRKHPMLRLMNMGRWCENSTGRSFCRTNATRHKTTPRNSLVFWMHRACAEILLLFIVTANGSHLPLERRAAHTIRCFSRETNACWMLAGKREPSLMNLSKHTM